MLRENRVPEEGRIKGECARPNGVAFSLNVAFSLTGQQAALDQVAGHATVMRRGGA
jgi:hypothetical protein